MNKIVCVEDEPQLRKDIADELREHGYDVIEAADGEQALRAIQTHEPDLVLCDVMMTGMSGYEVLDEVRRSGPPELPFVFLTALADRDHVIRGKDRGADDYVVKPVDYDLLLSTVAARLRQIQRLKNSQGKTFAADSLDRALSTLDRLQLGVMLVNEKGCVIRSNPYVYVLAGHNDTSEIRKEGNAVRIAGRLQRQVLALFSSAGSAADDACGLQIDRAGTKRPYTAQAALVRAPVGCERGAKNPIAVVLVADPEASMQLSKGLAQDGFGLTPAEFRLAGELLNGRSVKDVAMSQGVSEATVRTHLKALLSKTGTRRQGELIALLHRLAIVSLSETHRLYA